MAERSQQAAQVTVAIPSFNQASYLQQCLNSIYRQQIPLEICVADGASTDGSQSILQQNRDKLYWYESKPDAGQAAAVNQAVAAGSAPYVYWINSDDLILDGALRAMVKVLESNPEYPLVYGEAVYIDSLSRVTSVCPTQSFSRQKMALGCLISQPAVLVRREVWEKLGGLDEKLHMALDYEFWWRIADAYQGKLAYIEGYIAATRNHCETKTATRRRDHYMEAISVVKRHYPLMVPWWYIKWPWSVWYKTISNRCMKQNSK